MINHEIENNIIKNNKIYDYVRLVKILRFIVDKYNIMNSFFKINIGMLIYDKLSPSEVYLVKNLFKSFSNVNIKLLSPFDNFNNDTLLLSGNILYWKKDRIKKIKPGSYVLVGYSDNYDELVSNLENKYKININVYENSNMCIFESFRK